MGRPNLHVTIRLSGKENRPDLCCSKLLQYPIELNESGGMRETVKVMSRHIAHKAIDESELTPSQKELFKEAVDQPHDAVGLSMQIVVDYMACLEMSGWAMGRTWFPEVSFMKPFNSDHPPKNESTLFLHPLKESKPAIMNKQVKLHIAGMGVITIALDFEKAPISSQNFVDYAEKGHYDGTIFHRVIAYFMIQGGGYNTAMGQHSTGAPIRNEADNGLKNKRYSVAMARTSEPHSATAQFFINVADNGFLDHTAPSAQGWGYAVFGEVVEGQDVVDKIKGVKTGRKNFHDDVPLEPIVIERAEVIDVPDQPDDSVAA